MSLWQIVQLIFCRHRWLIDTQRIAPVGMQSERCPKCTAMRTVYAKGNST
jgi:hypothetical protein